VTAARIRRVSADDAGALAVLDAACFDEGWDEASVLGLLCGGRTMGWRLDVGDVLVAALLVRVVAGEGDILRVAVDPVHRRQGYGRALMRTAMIELAPVLPHGLHLDVRASNQPARALYASLGFAEVGRRPAYYRGPEEDAVLMRWSPSIEPHGPA
jgi:ribosomal-protein-alanine N-acetyltransferase